jgi:hypothetical protein
MNDLLKAIEKQEIEQLDQISKLEIELEDAKIKLSLLRQFREQYLKGTVLERGSVADKTEKPVVETVVEILEKEQRFLKTNEIRKKLIDKGRDIKFLSSYFTTSVSRNRIVKYKLHNDNNKVYQGLPDWLDSKGHPKKGYEIKE